MFVVRSYTRSGLPFTWFGSLSDCIRLAVQRRALFPDIHTTVGVAE